MTIVSLYQCTLNSYATIASWTCLLTVHAQHPDVIMYITGDVCCLQARLDKESMSQADWKAVQSVLKDLPAFHHWFYQTHLCYAVPRQHEFGVRTIKDDALLNSY